MRYRLGNGGVRNASRRNTVDTSTAFGVSGLSPSTKYETEASVDRGLDESSAVRGVFATQSIASETISEI